MICLGFFDSDVIYVFVFAWQIDSNRDFYIGQPLERFHLLLFSIKDSIFPIHMIGKFCYKKEKGKNPFFTWFMNRKFHAFNRKFHVFNRKFHVFDRNFHVFLLENFMFLIANFIFSLVILMQLMQNITRWHFLHQLYFCAVPLCQCKMMEICINFYEPVCPGTSRRFTSSPS